MKKVFIFIFFVCGCGVILAQTVCPASVTFRFCETTNGSYNITVPENLFPYDVDGYVFEDEGSHVFVLTNTRGCDSLLTVTVSKKSAYTFTVASGKTVVFSKGNLQYCATEGTHKCRRVDGTEETRDGTWRFAWHQYDCLRANDGNMNPGAAQTAWQDLFGYGTSGYTIVPYMAVRSDAAYATVNLYGGTNYANHDWGVYNAISNGGNEPGLWRTLTNAEWGYLLNSRSGYASKKALATIDGVQGAILLPDTWVDPQPNGKSFVAAWNRWTANVYTAKEWVAMELNGAVFLPNAGYRNTDNNEVRTVETSVTYYQSANYSSSKSLSVKITSSSIEYNNNWGTTQVGEAVRLVK